MKKTLLLPLAAIALMAQAVPQPDPKTAAPIQLPGPPKLPEMVLLPREMAIMMANWMDEPNALQAVQLHRLLVACIQANPTDGQRLQRNDQCPNVVRAISERNAEVEDLRRQLDAEKKLRDATQVPEGAPLQPPAQTAPAPTVPAPVPETKSSGPGDVVVGR